MRIDVSWRHEAAHAGGDRGRDRTGACGVHAAVRNYFGGRSVVALWVPCPLAEMYPAAGTQALRLHRHPLIREPSFSAPRRLKDSIAAIVRLLSATNDRLSPTRENPAKSLRKNGAAGED